MTRFTTITPNDHAGFVYVAAWYCLSASCLVAITRTWIKVKSLGADDLTFGIAFIAQLGHVVAIFVSLKDGLGRSWPSGDGNADAVEGTFAAQILFVIALAFTKVSVLFFVQRLLSHDLRRLWSVCTALIVAVAIWGLASIIALSARCSTRAFLSDPADTCPGQDLRWKLVTVFDAITELILVALPAFLVWPLQMPVKLKFQVVAAFVFRLPVAILAIMHTVYVGRYIKSVHPSLAIVPALVLQEAELCWSLVSSTIPNLRGFMKSFSTGFGFEIGVTTLDNHTASRAYGQQSYQLSQLSHKGNKPSASMDVLNPGVGEYSIDIVHESNRPAENSSISSGKSQEWIIRKDVTTTVDYKKRTKSPFP